MAFILGVCIPYIRTLFDRNISFDHITLIMTFDLLSKNFNMAPNFFTVRDRVIIFGTCGV